MHRKITVTGLAAFGLLSLLSLTRSHGLMAWSGDLSLQDVLVDAYVISGAQENVFHLNATLNAHLQPNGGVLGVVSGTESGLSVPLAITTFDRFVWVGEVGNGGGVQQYNRETGEALGRFGETDVLRRPTALAVDEEQGTLLATDTFTPAAVFSFDLQNGTLTQSFGEDQLQNPTQLRVDPDTGDRYVLNCPEIDCTIEIFGRDNLHSGRYPLASGTPAELQGIPDFVLFGDFLITAEPLSNSVVVNRADDGTEVDRISGLSDPSALTVAEDPTGQFDALILATVLRAGGTSQDAIQVIGLRNGMLFNLGDYNSPQLDGTRLGAIVASAPREVKAHVPISVSGEGSLTQLDVVNPQPYNLSVFIEIFENSGALIENEVKNLAPNGIWSLQVGPDGPLRAGWATATAVSPVAIAGSVELNVGGRSLPPFGTVPVGAGCQWTYPARESPDQSTGISIQNPSPTDPATCDLDFFDGKEGSPIGESGNFVVAAGVREQFFPQQSFPGGPGAGLPDGTYAARLTCSSAVHVAVLNQAPTAEIVVNEATCLDCPIR